MIKDTKPPHRFGPGYDLAYENTHSIGIQPHPHDHSIAKQLLGSLGSKMAEAADAKLMSDDRPLIDKLHEATFHNAIGLQWLKDHYGLRMLLRKAHCFTLDDTTSAMVADFSVAISQDLEAARQLAIPPFPVTWIDLDNRKRLDRMKELGSQLTPRASGILEGEPVERAGWLIHPGEHGGFYMTYVTEVGAGILLAPLSYWWHCGQGHVADRPDEDDQFLQELALGVRDSGIWPGDAFPSCTALHIDLLRTKHLSSQVRDMMVELAGELRHVWGFLIALGAGHLGAEARLSTQPTHTDVRQMPNGKPLLPLEHKVLHLHLGRKLSPKVVIGRAIFHHRKRWHEVRGHWRTYRDADGSVRKRIPIDAHERGDERLGRITKTYKVEK